MAEAAAVSRRKEMEDSFAGDEFGLELLAVGCPPPADDVLPAALERECCRATAARRRANRRAQAIFSAKTGSEWATSIEDSVAGWQDLDDEVKLQEILAQATKLSEDAVAERNAFVLDLKADLLAQDEEHEKEILDQQRDIDAYLSRAQAAEGCLREFYITTLDKMLEVFQAKLDGIGKDAADKFERLLRAHQDEQEQMLQDRLDRLTKAADELRALEQKSEVDFKGMQDKLNSRLHEMESDLLDAKLEYLLGAEMIEHNHVVLKKRIEEANGNLQASKRRLTKLNDTHAALMDRLAEVEKKAEEERSRREKEAEAEADRRQAIEKAVATRRATYHRNLLAALENELQEERKLKEELECTRLGT